MQRTGPLTTTTGTDQWTTQAATDQIDQDSQSVGTDDRHFKRPSIHDERWLELRSLLYKTRG